MSFGWSVGDLATAIAVTYSLIQALDDTNGAANDYCEAVSFLRDLKRILEPLHAFTAWSTYPAYGREIEEQIELVKRPMEEFLDAAIKYEPSLGENARGSREKRLPTTLRKLQWYILMSRKVLSLRAKIESHMRILDSLMQRLTLDIVWTAQQKLPELLRSTFDETIRPELIAVLRECLTPNSANHPVVTQETIIAKLSNHYQLISSDIKELRQQLRRHQVIPTCSRLPSQERDKGKELETLPDFVDGSPTAFPKQNFNRETLDRENLFEVYYLVVLYLGYFLKNLFIALSRLVQPPRPLLPALLAKYNISFLDAIGRPPRVLPYDCFRSFKAFIEHEFKSLPGSAWVDRGKYLIVNLRNNQRLNEGNWSESVVPGAVVAMSILFRKRLVFPINPAKERCPQSTCSGSWIRSEAQSWETCPVCQLEMIKTPLQLLEAADSPPEDQDLSNPPDSQLLANDANATQYCYPKDSGVEPKQETYNGDLSVFKRIAQEVVDINSLRNIPHERLSSDVWEHLKDACEEWDPGYTIKLDPKIRNIPNSERDKFWRVGRVFKMLWTESAQGLVSRKHNASSSITHISIAGLSEEHTYVKFRCFVVIAQGCGESICSPINTYSRRGTLKLNLSDRQSHAIIYTTKHVPDEVCEVNRDGVTVREELSKIPIRVSEDVRYKGDLDPSSRINYSKVSWLEIMCGSVALGWFTNAPSRAFVKIRVLLETSTLSEKEKRGEKKRCWDKNENDYNLNTEMKSEQLVLEVIDSFEV